MQRYITQNVYQYIHWINGVTNRPENTVNYIYSSLALSLKNPKKDLTHRKSRKPVKSSSTVLFMSGSSGLFDDAKLADEFGKVLLDNKCACFVVRDQNDNPEHFKEIRQFGGLFAVPDYTVVTVTCPMGEKRNVLCVGGAITPNRSWKLNSEAATKKLRKISPYYKDEAPFLNQEALDEIVNDEKMDIDMVVSVTPIMFAGTDPFDMCEKWSLNDPTLIKDVMESREVMNKILFTLRENNKAPKIWYHSQRNDNDRNISMLGVKFASVNSTEDYFNLLEFFRTCDNKKKIKRMGGHNQIQSMIAEEEHMSAGRGMARGMAHNDPVNRLRDMAFGHTDIPDYGEILGGDGRDVEEEFEEDVAQEAPDTVEASEGAPNYDNFFDFIRSDNEAHLAFSGRPIFAEPANLNNYAITTGVSVADAVSTTATPTEAIDGSMFRVNIPDWRVGGHTTTYTIGNE